MSKKREELKEVLPWSSNMLATKIFEILHEPDPNAVAIVADKLNLDATKVAAVWMLMVEEMSK